MRNFPLLADVGDAGLKRVLGEANWFGLPGGTALRRDGENAQALFLVVTGNLGVFVEDEHKRRRLVAHVPAGETVGEMSLISGESEHSAEIVALRDTELLRISAQGFDALIARHPRVMLNLMRILVKRLQATTHHASDGSRPKTFAIVPLQEGLDHEPIAHRVAAALTQMGSRAAVPGRFGLRSIGGMVQCLRGLPTMSSSIAAMCPIPRGRIYACVRPTVSFCWRGSDRPLPLRPLDMPAAKERAGSLPELLLLHPSSGLQNLPEHFALRSGLFESHHHLRTGNTDDICRLARFISGRAVGIVLAGGGARGFAHIGVLKALREAGVPFDNLGGTSMGAIIAAGLAAEWSLEELTERVPHGVRRIQSALGLHVPLDRRWFAASA